MTVCILLEDIECHHNWYPEQLCYLDLLPEIATATPCNKTQILEEKETGTRNKNEEQSLEMYYC